MSELDLDQVAARAELALNCRSGMAPANRPAQDALLTMCRKDVPSLITRIRELEAHSADG